MPIIYQGDRIRFLYMSFFASPAKAYAQPLLYRMRAWTRVFYVLALLEAVFGGGYVASLF